MALKLKDVNELKIDFLSAKIARLRIELENEVRKNPLDGFKNAQQIVRQIDEINLEIEDLKAS